jgi:hypothetical protein
MGAPASVSVTRASTRAGASAAAPGARASPVVSGLPAYMQVVDAGQNAGDSKGEIEALQQQEQTDDRDVAESLADRIGQTDAREAMQAEDARKAAQTDTAQRARDGLQDVSQAKAGASTRAPSSRELVWQANADSSFMTTGGEDNFSADGQSSLDDRSVTGDAVGTDGRPQAASVDAEGNAMAPQGMSFAGAPGGGAQGGTAAGRNAGGKSDAAAGAAADGQPGSADKQAAGDADGSGPVAEDVPRTADPDEPDTHAGELGTDDLVLIDVELAEHQRWAAAADVVGAAGSMERAEFIAQTVGSGFVGGVASGGAMSLGIGLVTRAVPGLGPIIGAGMGVKGLIQRDWSATGDTIAKIGKGRNVYDMLANTLQSVSTVIQVVDNILDTIGSIAGIVRNIAIGVAAGAGVLAFFTLGATAGVAVEAGELADVCHTINKGCTAVTMTLGAIDAIVLEPCIELFRSLDEFTSQADPREVEAGQAALAEPAAAMGGALGGWIGGKVAHIGAPKPPPNDGAGTDQKPPHETPPATGDGPEVHFQEPPTTSSVGSEDLPSPPRTSASSATAAPAEPTLDELDAMPGRQISDTASSSSPDTPAPGTPAPEFHSQGWVPPEVDVPPPGFQPPQNDNFVPNVPGLDDNIIYGDAVPNRNTIGTNVQRDHILAQAKIRDMTQGPPDSRLPPNIFPAIPSRALTVVAETGAATATRGPLPHTAATFHGPNADVPQIQQLRAQGGPEHISSDIVEPSRDVRLAAGYPPQETDRGWVDQLGRAGQQFPPAHWEDPEVNLPDGAARPPNPRLHDSFTALEQHEHTTPAPMQSDADFDASLDAAFPSSPMPMGPHPELPVWGVTDPQTGAVRPANGAEVMEAITRGKSGLPNEPGQAQLMQRPAPTPGPDDAMQVSDGSGRSKTPLAPQQYQAGADMAVEMGARPDQVAPTTGATRFIPGANKVMLGADLNRLPESERPDNLQNPANAALEPRAVIGHEVIGHMEAALGGATRSDPWHEEYQASVRAALHTPGLSDEQRSLLLQDAAARLRFQTREGKIYVDIERYGQAAEAKRAAERAKGGGSSRAGEPSVIIDPSLYEPEAASPAAARPMAEPEGTASMATPHVTGSTPPGNAGAGGGPEASALSQAVGRAAASTQPEPAHDAAYTDDNQPAAGVQRVNPHYSPPPGTPDQVVALQNEIVNLLAVRARAEVESEHEADRVQACEANRAPIAASIADAHGSLGAVRAHEQAIARRDAMNLQQQQRQQKSASLTGSYAEKATGLGILETPLAAWEGFTSLASHLPGSAGDKMAELNTDARNMQDAFGKMDGHMGHADGEQPARAAELDNDSQRIASTGAQAQASHEQLQTAADGAAGLQSANEATLGAAQQRQQAADQRRDELDAAAADRQASADSLAEQMRAWAQTHRDERAQAVAATVAQLQDKGKIVTESPTE